MKFNFRLNAAWCTTLCASVLALATTSNAAPPGDQSGWRLTFEDSFAAPELDATKWRTDWTFPNKEGELVGTRKRRRAFYSPENVEVKNGLVTLHAKIATP